MKINYSHGVITPEEIIKYLSLSGRLQSVIDKIIENREVVKKAEELNLSVSNSELQEYADNYRASHGLYSSGRTHEFLDVSGLTEDDFESYCEAGLLCAKLMDYLADKKRIEEYFLNNHSDLDLARIYIIRVKDKSLADEILIQIQEEGKDFFSAAKEYSTDESTKYGGGYLGLISRKMLQPEVEAKVFNASAGDILGPYEREGIFELIMVEEVKRAELDNTMQDKIQKLIFEEWMLQFKKNGFRISI